MTTLGRSSNVSGQFLDLFTGSNFPSYSNSVMDPLNNVWSHTVPNKMPWAPPHQPAIVQDKRPSVMQFTGGSSLTAEVRPPDPCTSRIAAEWELLNTNLSSAPGPSSHHHLKRRNSSSEDEDGEIQPPTKQYISEEKFTAQFNQMRISNGSSPPSVEQKEKDEQESQFFEADMDQEGRPVEGRLYVSEEVRKVLEQPTDLVGKIIKEEAEKASKAIILWQPPIGVLAPQLAAYRQYGRNGRQQQHPRDDDLLDVDLIDASPMDAEIMDL